MPDKEHLKEFVKKCYNEILHRASDQIGWNHYENLLEKNQISESDLKNIFKNSKEYKLSHPVEFSQDISIEKQMKNDWNQRAKTDTLFVIATDHSENEENFWKSGYIDCQNFLGKS